LSEIWPTSAIAISKIKGLKKIVFGDSEKKLDKFVFLSLKYQFFQQKKSPLSTNIFQKLKRFKEKYATIKIKIFDSLKYQKNS
jgi:hypothetical protein